MEQAAPQVGPRVSVLKLARRDTVALAVLLQRIGTNARLGTEIRHARIMEDRVCHSA